MGRCPQTGSRARFTGGAAAGSRAAATGPATRPRAGGRSGRARARPRGGDRGRSRLPLARDLQSRRVVEQLLLPPLALLRRQAHQLQLDRQRRLAVLAPLALAALRLRLGRALLLLSALLARLVRVRVRVRVRGRARGRPCAPASGEGEAQGHGQGASLRCAARLAAPPQLVAKVLQRRGRDERRHVELSQRKLGRGGQVGERLEALARGVALPVRLHGGGRCREAVVLVP